MRSLRQRPRSMSTLYRILVFPLSMLLNNLARYGLALTMTPPHNEDAPCADFKIDGEANSWRYADCMAVWNGWTQTVPEEGVDNTPISIRAPLRKFAKELRDAGSQCYLTALKSIDGAGSSAMRSITTYVLAQAIGCKWVSPEWGRPVVGKNGSILYCHEKLNKAAKQIDFLAVGAQYNAVCSIVDWIDFFRFPQASVPLPVNGTAKVLQFDKSPRSIRDMLGEVQSLDVARREWDHVVFTVQKSTGAAFVVTPSLWDNFQQTVARNLLQSMREQFHKPRPGKPREIPRCGFEAGILNFGIHVRMGDRAGLDRTPEEFLTRLNGFMDTVTEVTAELGIAQPVFHVFSESQQPCPHADTATFEEFPLWPVDMNEVHACEAAETPVDCLELQAGLSSCPPDRSGIFHVKDRPLLIHVGADVRNEMSCMVHADGMMTGCSTFGQVAGLLSKGLKFFSIGCDGPRTPPHYKTLPPLALAERGDKWVPVRGSWHDPELMSRDILKKELVKIIHNGILPGL